MSGVKRATFIGHGECAEVNAEELRGYLRELISLGVEEFLCGGMGGFDILCAGLVHGLKAEYPSVRCVLVIPYLTFRTEHGEYFDEVIYPEGLERYHFKAAIAARNRYLVDNSEYAVCFVEHSWGGAAKTFAYAERRELAVKNFGNA